MGSEEMRYNVAEWRDTITKVVLGILLSNVVWIFFWGQSVATEQWVLENPAILKTIPTLRTDVTQISVNRAKIESLDKNQTELKVATTSLDKTVGELRVAIKELSTSVTGLQIAIAKGDSKR